MMLVVLFFMNVKAESPLTKLFAGAGFFWLILLARPDYDRLRLAQLDARRQVLVNATQTFVSVFLIPASVWLCADPLVCGFRGNVLIHAKQIASDRTWS